MMKQKILFFFFILIFAVIKSTAQTDTVFWFVAPEASSFNNYDRPIYLRLTAHSQSATVTISQPANASFGSIVRSISANQTVSVDLSSKIDSVENKPANKVLNRGILIRSNVPISAYYEITATVNPDIFVLKGKQALGNEFYIPTQNQYPNNSTYSPAATNAFDIVAIEDNTTVSITPSQNIVGHSAGISFNVVLNKGQTYSAVASSQTAAGHLIGSKVTSTKPVAITIKDDLLANSICSDMQGDQLVPTSIIVNDYVVIKGSLSTNDLVYILAVKNNTGIYLNGSSTPLTTLNAGQYYVYSLSAPVVNIHTSQPVYVYHNTGHGCEIGGALLPGITCTGSNKVSIIRTTNESFYVNLVTTASAKDSFQVNGSYGVITGTSFSAVPGSSTLVYAYIDLSSKITVGNPVMVTNRIGSFSLGVIHGGSATGTRYGYFSGYSSLYLGPDFNMCMGSTITLDAGEGGTSYLWNTGKTTQKIQVSTAGIYSVIKVQNSCNLYDTIKVTTIPMPSAGFNITSDTIQCSNKNTFTFQNTSTISSGTMNYLWKFGDDSTSKAINASHSYQKKILDGIYKVTLIASSIDGCKDSVFRRVYARPVPKVNYSINDTDQCLPGNKFIFSDSSKMMSTVMGGNISGYLYNFGDATSSNQPNTNHTYAAFGYYRTYLKVTTTHNCYDSLVKYVAVLSTPSVAFTINDTMQCLGSNSFNFESKSTVSPGTILSENWNFGDTTTGIGKSVNHVYSHVNNYKVKLKVTSNSGCADSLTKSIRVIPTPQSGFICNDTSQCVSSNNFLFSSTTPLVLGYVYKWKFGDGDTATGPTASHSYTSAGVKNVTLIVIAGNCKDSITKQVIVGISPDANFNMNSSQNCLDNNNIVFTNTSIWSGTGTLSYKWLFGDGDSAKTKDTSHTYKAAGTFIVTLFAVTPEGCVDSFNRSVTIHPNPVSFFRFVRDSSQCITTNYYEFKNLSTGSSITSYLWNFGDTKTSPAYEPAHIYSSPGNYKVLLTVQNSFGCQDTFSRTANVRPLPIAYFDILSDTTQCLNWNEFFFKDSSTVVGNPRFYSWSFGDATTSNVINPKHTYTSPGTFTIRLIVSTPGGCNDTAYDNVTVYAMPGAKFSVDDTVRCPKSGRTFKFTNLTPNPVPPVTISYFWDFGEPPATSTLKNPTYTYTKPGIYNVRLIARNPGNACADTHTVTVVAAAAPVVYFKNYDSIQCFDRNLFHFTNLSSVKFGSITYLWNFGDGDTSIALNPTHHYNTIDTFTVKLIGTTNYGCTDSFKWHTYLKNGVRPLATFTLNDTNQCLKGNNFVFTNTSTIAAGTIVDQIWSFDDGDTSHKHDVNHIYLVDGIKNSKLFVRSDAGCTDSVIHPLLVAPKPRAAFLQNDSTQCLNENIFAYNNTTSISLGTYNSFWDFDDGAVSLLKSPSHTFSQVLTYSVMLLTVSDLGCRDSVTHTSTTFPVPDAKLDLKSDTIQCFKGNKFSFSDKSTMSGGTIIANLWRFGDGNSVMNDPAPFHSYNDTGTYNVSLVIASSNICYDTANVVVTVADGPVVDFAVNDSTQCLGGNGFAFTNNSSIGIGTLSYLWKFGDGDTSTMINPVHSYTYQNTFNVKLIAKSSIGCSDSNSHNMYVANMQKAGFTINDSDQCLKNNFFQFMNTTTPMIPGTMFYWEFGNGDTSTAVHPSYIYTTTGTFQVKLKILTGNGCDDSIMKNVYVGISQQTSFDVNDTMQCLSGNVFNFTNTSSISVGTLTYLWDFGNNQTSTQTNPSFSFITDGTHPVKLISASSQGCTDSIIRNVYIMPAQTTSFTVNDTSQCLTGNQFIFTNTSSFPSGTLTYLWDFGNGNTSTSVNISYSYIVKGKYTVKLVSVSDINCRDSAFQDVYIGDPPTADFDVNDSSQCLAGNNFVFTNQSTAPSGTIIGAYAWYFGDGSSSAAANPNYTYAVPDTFNVKLVAKTTGGCDDSITKMVYVRPMPKADFTMNSNPQNLFGNNFVFTNTSTILNGSLTSAWDFGDGNTATTTNASHSYTTADTFPVRLLLTSDHGCTDTIIKPAYVTSGPPPSINVDFTFQNACVGEPVLFINTSTVNQDSFMNFFWDFGDTTQTIIRTNPTHVYKYTGTYLVKLRGVTWGGMQDSTSQLITIYNKPTLNISYSPDTIGIIGEKITLTANGSFNTLLWSTGEQTSSILVDKTGIYAVKVFNTTNCSATDSIFIEFVMQEVLEAMTLFTPNGDGYNDYFKVLNIDLFRPLKLVIYNRWGNELFSSENYMNDWDGKYKGQELPEGTYYYVIIDRNGTVYKGAVSLMQDGY